MLAGAGLVYAGLAAYRESPGGSVGDLLAGLHAARFDADRAAALAARVRWRLSAAEDRLRRTRKAADVVAARHIAAAITRLDLVVARLGVGSCRIERSVAALTEEPAAPPAPSRPASHDNDGEHDNHAGSADVIARGCHAASALVARRHRLTRPRAHRRALTMIRRRRW
ncbi:hypothetical protein AB0B94_14775 [Micromonospora sp. NPDC048986]|uniref:hypothetical protein n=1 Tax=Micromonospora sp. NPDC048986 TaxID=3155644 RepID=UPI0033D64A45